MKICQEKIRTTEGIGERKIYLSLLWTLFGHQINGVFLKLNYLDFSTSLKKYPKDLTQSSCLFVLTMGYTLWYEINE